MEPRPATQLSDLSLARRRLVDNIRHWGFGCFEHLRIKDGDPVWDPPPEITSDIKFGNPSMSLPAHERDGRTLNQQFLQLFDEFDRRRNFTIKYLGFQNGLPLRMRAKETAV